MSRDDFDRRFVERRFEQIGGFPRKRHDIGAHPRRLGVDIDADNARVRHGDRGAHDEASLRAGTPCAMHDR
jgi:hypothetical protein